MADHLIHAVKTCTKCGVEKPDDKDHFRSRGDVVLADCRDCHRIYCKAYYERNKERMLAGFREARAADPDFHRERDRRYFTENREAKREAARRKWAKTDKAVAAEKLKAWKAANPEKQKAIDARRAEKIKADPHERAKASARTRKHRAKIGPVEAARRALALRVANPERSKAYTRQWRLRNLEKARAADRAFRKANPEKVIAHSEKRRARLLNAEGSFTGHDVIALIKQFGRICFYCESKLKKFEVDHFVPLSRGGSNWPDNLVISCRACNLSKAAKMPWEWKPGRFAEGCTPR